MNIAFHLAWWQVPLVITIVTMAWALFWPADDGGYLGGIVRMFMLVPALLVSALAWAVGGILK